MAIRVLFLIVFLGLRIQVSAQVDRATLVGTITDSSGAVVTGARVEAVSQETGLRRAVQTGETGVYTLSQLPIGVYTVTAAQAGFRTVAI